MKTNNMKSVKFESRYKLVGLEKVNNSDIVATCEVEAVEVTFKARLNMSLEKKVELWRLCEGDWAHGFYCTVKYEEFSEEYDCLVPRDGVITEVSFKC